MDFNVLNLVPDWADWRDLLDGNTPNYIHPKVSWSAGASDWCLCWKHPFVFGLEQTHEQQGYTILDYRHIKQLRCKRVIYI